MKFRALISSLGFTYLAAAISFGVQFWIARQMGPTIFGTFVSGILIANMLEVVILFGSDRTLIRDLVQQENPNRVFWLCNRLKVILAFVAVPIAIAYIFLTDSKTSSDTSLVCLLAMTGCIQAFTPSSWYDFKGQLPKQVSIVLLEKILFALFVLTPVLVFSQTANMMAATVAFCLAVAIGMTLQWTLRPADEKAQDVKNGRSVTIQSMAFANFPIALAAMGNLGMTHVNQLTLKSSLGPESLACFAIAFQVVRIGNLFFSQFGRFYGPRIARITLAYRSRPRFVMRSILSIAGLAFVFSSILAVTLFFGGRFLISSFLQPSYAPARTILIFLCLWCAFFGPANVVGRAVIGLHMKNTYFACATVFGLISVLIGFLLIPILEGSGAAIALLVGHTGSMITQFAFVAHKLRQSSVSGVQAC